MSQGTNGHKYMLAYIFMSMETAKYFIRNEINLKNCKAPSVPVDESDRESGYVCLKNQKKEALPSGIFSGQHFFPENNDKHIQKETEIPMAAKGNNRPRKNPLPACQGL